VGSTSLSITALPMPGIIDSVVQRGSIVTIGNGVLTCVDRAPTCVAARLGVGQRLDRHDYPMRYVQVDDRLDGKDDERKDDDEDDRSFNSSAADLNVRGEITRAVLVWSGDTEVGNASAPDPDERDEVQLTLPDGDTITVTADAVRTSGEPSEYIARADVTELVRSAGNGAYTVADIQTAAATSSFGGWSLTVITADDADPLRILTVLDPAMFIEPKLAWSASVPVSVAAGSGVSVTFAAFDGELGLSRERATIDGADMGSSNLFDSTIGGARRPAPVNHFGASIPTVTGRTAGHSDVTVSVRSDVERVRLAIATIAIDLAP
jgi:hypothetical protein